MCPLFPARIATVLFLLIACFRPEGFSATPDFDDAPVAANQFRLKDLPGQEQGRHGASVGMVKGAIIVVGGLLVGDEVGDEAGDEDSDPGSARFARSLSLLPAPPLQTKREKGLAHMRKTLGFEEEEVPDLRQWQAVEIDYPVAYAAATVDGAAMYLAGGMTPDGLTSAVVRVSETAGAWVVEPLPPLPQPVALSGAAVMGNRLYVAGGVTDWENPSGGHTMWILDLGGDLNALGRDAWTAIELPYEEGVLLPTLTVRMDEVAIANALFLIGGWQAAAEGGPDNPMIPHAETFKYLPPEQSHSGWKALRMAPQGIALDTAIPVGPSHIVLSGRKIGPEGEAFESILTPPESGDDAVLKSYHLFTNRWVSLLWPDVRLDQPIIHNNGGGFLITSEAADGTWNMQSAVLFYAERHFSLPDYIAMVIYLLALVAIGKYFARRDRGTEFFFLGGRKIPWWAAGLSIYATGTSAISFMAIPAKTYSTDWLYFIGLSIFPFFTLILAAYLFIPLLRRLEITTVMEYFDLRFGRSVRFLMSFVSVMGQVAGRMSITLLLPSLALTAVTGANIYVSIVVMGVLATLYTVMGGISAVIWTDVLQVGVLFGGAILSFLMIIGNVDGGFSYVIDLAVEENKFNLFDFRPDLTTATMWIMLLWAVSDVFGKGLGQEGLQRAFSTPDVRAARRSMITCAVVALPAGFLFYGIGTALFAYYSQHPESLNPTLQTDSIFPLFIAQQLPVGIAGLVISALFAAAMSTLDTAMNSVSAILTRDFYSVINKDAPERHQMRMAKWITIACGIIGTGIALYMASFENLGSLWDRFSILLALIGGGLGGVGALALLTTRANTAGTLLGVVFTSAFIYWLRFYAPVVPGVSPLHFFAYGTASLVVGFTTGYLFSVIAEALFPDARPRDLTGLTLWTPAK